MKLLYYSFSAFLMVLSITLSAQELDNKVLSAKQLNIVTALEERDFRTAKTEISQFLPMLKKEQKVLQKRINASKKDGGSEELLSSLKSKFDRRNTLMASLEKILKVSPSALRVRSEQVADHLRTFDFSREIPNSQVAKVN